MTEECCLLSFCPWLAQILLFHVAQHHLPRDSKTLSVFDHPTSINNWENTRKKVATSQSDGGNSSTEGPSSQVYQIDNPSWSSQCPQARASHPTEDGSDWCEQCLDILEKRQGDMKLVSVANSLCDFTYCFIYQSPIPPLCMLEDDPCGILVMRNQCDKQKGLSRVPDKPCIGTSIFYASPIL